MENINKYKKINNDWLFCEKCNLVQPLKFKKGCVKCDNKSLKKTALFSGIKKKNAKKGSRFERDLSKQLSLWWSNQERDDIFWRTAGSGGRATQRSKQNKTTYGNYGDIKSDDPCGRALTDLFVMELKCGYTWDILSVIDSNQKETEINSFIKQAYREMHEAKTNSYLIFFKRDFHEPCVLLERRLASLLKTEYNILLKRRITILGHIIVPLEDFFEIDPEIFKNINRWGGLKDV